MKKIILFEPNHFHEEVLVPQINFLKEIDCDFEVYVNYQLKSTGVFDEFTDVKFHYIKPIKNRLYRTIVILTTLFLCFRRPHTIILNTCKNDFYQKILSYLTPGVKKVGIVHNMDILKEKIPGFHNFIFLSKNLYQYALKTHPNNQYSFFYPLLKTGQNLKSFPDGKVNIVIPGLIQHMRRDYLGLIKMVDKARPTNVKFTLLGNAAKYDGPEVLSKINEKGLQDWFETFDGFVPYDIYFQRINGCHLLMPLIQPSSEYFEDYHHSKITGGFNMAFSSNTPMLMYDTFKDIDEFKNFCVFYNFENFQSTLENIDTSVLLKISNNIKNSDLFKIENQRSNYKNFIS